MDVRIMRFSRRTVGLHGLQIAKDGSDAPGGERVGSLRGAHERSDLMICAQRRVEYRGTDISRRSGKKDLHAGSYIIIQRMRRDTLLDFFHDVSAGRGEFLVYDDGYRARSYSYAETATAARGFAARLQTAGLGKGDKVVFWSENRPEWIIALWGCLLNGSIAVPIDYRASHDFLGNVARIVEAKLLLLGDDVELADLKVSTTTDITTTDITTTDITATDITATDTKTDAKQYVVPTFPPSPRLRRV